MCGGIARRNIQAAQTKLTVIVGWQRHRHLTYPLRGEEVGQRHPEFAFEVFNGADTVEKLVAEQYVHAVVVRIDEDGIERFIDEVTPGFAAREGVYFRREIGYRLFRRPRCLGKPWSC